MTSSGSLDFNTKSSLFSYSFSLCSCSQFLANHGSPECALVALWGINTENMGDLTMRLHTDGIVVLCWGASSPSLHPPLWTFVHGQQYLGVLTGWVVCYWHQVGERKCAAKEPVMLRDSTAMSLFNSNGSKAMVETPSDGEISIDFVAKDEECEGASVDKLWTDSDWSCTGDRFRIPVNTCGQ